MLLRDFGLMGYDMHECVYLTTVATVTLLKDCQTYGVIFVVVCLLL
jgi:hypothetical protein